MSDELSASSWSSAQLQEEQEEPRQGDATTSTITRSQSFDSVPRVSQQHQQQLKQQQQQQQQQQLKQHQIESPRNEASLYHTAAALKTVETPRHESTTYGHTQQISIESPISPSQNNSLSKIMSVASSRFSRFTLNRDRDDDSSRVPSPFPEHNGRKGSRFPGSDHSIISHNTNSNSNANLSNSNNSNNMNKRSITVATTPRGGSAATTPVNVSTMIPASAVVEAQQKASTDDSDEALLELNQTLLEAIAANDWENYSALCDSDITCIEPESQGHVLRGIAFHRYFFDKATPELRHDINVLMTNAHVRRLGDHAALICYTRINQRLDNDGKPTVSNCNETRVWQKKEDGFWWNVHFHRS